MYNHMEKLVKDKRLALPGLAVEEFQERSNQPTYAEADYTMTFPSADGFLPLRQKTLDEWSCKFTELLADFYKIVDAHNKMLNPTGTPHKEGSKRTAS